MTHMSHCEYAWHLSVGPWCEPLGEMHRQEALAALARAPPGMA